MLKKTKHSLYKNVIQTKEQQANIILYTKEYHIRYYICFLVLHPSVIEINDHQDVSLAGQRQQDHSTECVVLFHS